jgi:Domain of unknown function (DUF4129)
MTARQQIARLLPLILLVVLVIAGLRGVVAAPRWDGPLRADGIAIGIALEVILAGLLVAVRVRDRAVQSLPLRTAAEQDLRLPRALRTALTYLLGGGMVAVAVVLLTDLHLHFFSAPKRPPAQVTKPRPSLKPPAPGPQGSGGGSTLHIPLGPILYALLVIVIVAAVVVSIWWSTRLRRPAQPLVIEDVTADELREAVAEGRAALARIDDARAAIIACYVAMERSLAERGTTRAAADTPDELLARAVASGTVRGGAATRLTALFYEARFSTHPLSGRQRDAASAALDDLAAELTAQQPPSPASPASPASPPGPGGGRG